MIDQIMGKEEIITRDKIMISIINTSTKKRTKMITVVGFSLLRVNLFSETQERKKGQKINKKKIKAKLIQT